MPELSPFSRTAGVSCLMGRELRVAETRHEDKLLLMGNAHVLGSLLQPHGLDVPKVNSSSSTAHATLLWLSPHQSLLLTSADLANQLRAAANMQSQHSFSVHDAGARFVGLSIQGASASEFLSAGCSLDLRDAQFRVGSCAQTRLEQAPVILFRRAAGEFELMVERPLAQYLWLWAQEVAQDWSTQEVTC